MDLKEIQRTLHVSWYFLAPSYNQPKFCSNPSWNPNAVTFANESSIGAQPYGMFVDANDTVYIVSRQFNVVKMWSLGTSTWTRNISDGLNLSSSVFVGNNGDVYVDNGNFNHHVDKWTFNSTTGIAVMNTSNDCFGLFIDANNTLYCSYADENRVVRQFLEKPGTAAVTYVGNGTRGSAANMLDYPCGIFIDDNLTLYVADCGNDRIQIFDREKSNGTTAAGNGSINTINLNCPTGVVLDGHGYLFIVDSLNHRVVASGPHGFRCIVGCTNGAGAGFNQLNEPRALSFDSFGNIYVVDTNNSRVQKFVLATNACGKYNGSRTTESSKPVSVNVGLLLL